MEKKRSACAVFFGHLLGIAGTVGLILLITKTKKGRKIAGKARRIAGEVEELVKDELKA